MGAGELKRFANDLNLSEDHKQQHSTLILREWDLFRL
jgi:hypothetical protein